jgi:hypothetical protein
VHDQKVIPTHQAKNNQKYCPGKTGKSTDDDGDPIESDIWLSGILHEVKKIHDKQRNKPDYGIYRQLCDVPDDEAAGRYITVDMSRVNSPEG